MSKALRNRMLERCCVGALVFANATEDMCSPQGFTLCVAMVMSLKSNGLLWLATVCSTWVFICLGTSQRTKLNPLGRQELPCVASANLMVSRSVLLMRLCAAKGGTWILEQPMSSLMIYHPRLQDLARECQIFKTSFCMGAYGAPSKKPTKLYSNRDWIGGFQKKLPPKTKFANLDISRPGINIAGQAIVTGGKGLKETQTYPPQFGKTVSKHFAKSRAPLKAQAKAPKGTTVLDSKRFVRLKPGDDAWNDADLKSVYSFLGI